MMRPFSALRRTSTLSVVVAFLFLSSSAIAQDPEPSDSSAEPEETTPEPEGKSESEEPSEAKPASDKKEGALSGEPKPVPKTARMTAVSLVGLEILPGDAYPDPTTRGIHGGSMWLNMHGLQWPYMPFLGDAPGTRIGFSGSVWVDSSYARTNSGRPQADPNVNRWEQQARFVLRVTPTYSTSEGWFAQGQGEFVANGAAAAQPTQLVDTDDLYVRAGKWKLFDLTAGRFQGWEIYHLGMALDLNTFERTGPATNQNPASPAQIYGVTNYWDRPNGPGNLALHLYGPEPIEFLRAEVLTQIGNVGGLQERAIRAVGIADWGMDLPGDQGYRLSVKFKAGYEYGKDTPREQGEQFKEKVMRKGGGASLQFVFDPYVDIGGGVARGIRDWFDQETGEIDTNRSNTTTTFGGFLNVQPVTRLVVGFGYHQTEQVTLRCTEILPPPMPGAPPTRRDCSSDAVPQGNFDSYKLTQYFGAVQYEILPNLFSKLVLAHGKADYNVYTNPDVEPYSHQTGSLMGMPIDVSARLRFMYLF